MVRSEGEDDEQHIKQTLEDLGANSFQARVIATQDDYIDVGGESDGYAVKIGDETYDTFGDAVADNYDLDKVEEQAGITRDRDPGDPISDGGYNELDEEDERIALGELRSEAAQNIWESQKE